MTRVVFYIIAIILSALVALVVGPSNEWFAIPTGIAVALAVPLLDTAASNFRWIKYFFYSIKTRRKHVRISFSYLFRIKVDEVYLLVRGKRFNQFQPVGGVYKFNPSSEGLRQQLDVRDDDLLIPDATSDQDLRVRIPGKHLVGFLKWLEVGTGRETSAHREFHEELIANGALPRDIFEVIRYDWIRRHYEPMRFSSRANAYELLVADIIDLLPSPEQLKALRALRGGNHPDIFWATETQISRLGMLEGSSTQENAIAQTATWTIDRSSIQ